EDMIEGPVEPVFLEEKYEPDYTQEELLQDFLSFWNKGKYDVLYDMFPDYAYSKEEFAFLARNAAEAEQIDSISIERKEGNVVKFRITTNRYVKKMPTTIILEGDEWNIKPFYIFSELDPAEVCTSRAEAVTLEECGLGLDDTDKTTCITEKRKQCLYDYAQVSGERDYCNYTSNLKGGCLMGLGIDIDIDQMVSDCYAHESESDQAKCLLSLAESTKDIAVCDKISFERTQFTCYGKMAAFDGSVTMCNKNIKRGDFYTSFRYALCVFGYVQQSGDASKCSLIPNSDNSRVGAIAEDCSKVQRGVL
ncbi:MAG: hypothetical protein ACE5DM_05605, partial [Candidatus Nanoarchaeia archaeon]